VLTLTNTINMARNIRIVSRNMARDIMVLSSNDSLLEMVRIIKDKYQVRTCRKANKSCSKICKDRFQLGAHKKEVLVCMEDKCIVKIHKDMSQVRIVEDKYQVRICKGRDQVRKLLVRCLTSLNPNNLSLLLILASRQHSCSQRLLVRIISSSRQLVRIVSSQISNSRLDQCKQGKWTRNKDNSSKVMVNISKAAMVMINSSKVAMVNKGCFTRISDMKQST